MSFARVTNALQPRSAIHVEPHFAHRHVEKNAWVDVVEMGEAIAIENYSIVRALLGIPRKSGKKKFRSQIAIVCQSRGFIASSSGGNTPVSAPMM